MGKIIILSLVVPIVIALIFILVFQGNPQNNNQNNNLKVIGATLFYSLTCPHCQNVEKFVKENKVEEKYKFERIDVNKNQENSDLFIQKSTECKIPQDKLGIPLFWDGKNCINGDQPIIDFFKTKLK